MRTTIILDDALFRKAKERAARTNTTLSSLVSQALRENLEPRRAPTPRPVFRMPTYTGPAPLDHAPGDFHALLDSDDVPVGERPC